MINSNRPIQASTVSCGKSTIFFLNIHTHVQYNLTLVYLKALATVQGSGYSFKKTWLQSKMADLPESYTTNAHFTEVTLSMPI